MFFKIKWIKIRQPNRIISEITITDPITRHEGRIDAIFEYPDYVETVEWKTLCKEPPGTYRAFTNGFFVFLQPLGPGTHNLHLTVSVTNPIKTQFNYAADWTYHLIVK